MNAKDRAREQAETIHTFKSVEEVQRFARASANPWLAKLLPAHIKYNGYYAARFDNVKIYFELKET